MKKVKRVLSIVFMLLICAMAVPMLSWGSPAVAENKKAEAAQGTSEIAYSVGVETGVETTEVPVEAVGEVEIPEATETPVEAVKSEEKPVSTPAPVSTPKPVTTPATVSTPTPAAEPVHTHSHSWNPVYRTVHHEAEYKTVNHPAETKTVHHDAVTEQVWVVDQAAYDEQVENGCDFVCVCSTCGWTSPTHYVAYDYDAMWRAFEEMIAHHESSVNSEGVMTCCGKREKKCTNYTTVHHDEVGHYETRIVTPAYDETVTVKEAWTEKVLVKEAYDSQVIDHYECSCGEKKPK